MNIEKCLFLYHGIQLAQNYAYWNTWTQMYSITPTL